MSVAVYPSNRKTAIVPKNLHESCGIAFIQQFNK